MGTRSWLSERSPTRKAGGLVRGPPVSVPDTKQSIARALSSRRTIVMQLLMRFVLAVQFRRMDAEVVRAAKKRTGTRKLAGNTCDEEDVGLLSLASFRNPLFQRIEVESPGKDLLADNKPRCATNVERLSEGRIFL